MSDHPTTVEIRRWAQSKPGGHTVRDNGELPKFVIAAWNRAHPDRPYVAGQAWHGTFGGYRNHHCRCEPCSSAMSEYMRNYEAAGRAGRWDFES